MASNVPPPPMPPPAPVPAPTQYAPQAPVAPKKLSPLVWVLAGCGVIVLLIVIVLAVGGFLVGRKIKGFADDAKRNPAVAAAVLVVSANPELELVDKDYDRGTVTIRNKKTGEVITIDAEDVKNGRLRFRNEKGEEMTFEGKGDSGGGTVKVTGKDGQMTFGAGTEIEAPSWLPLYPGSKAQGNYSATAPEGRTGGYTFQTPDEVEKVISFYRHAFEEEGLEVNSSTFEANGKVAGGTITGKSGNREVGVTIGRDNDSNTCAATVMYKSGKGD
ncbi:MAG TPA: hypothetical protein PLS53_11250 [Thermoanaerobaculaceae bacterium]|nr:hypothetical protein [Thermoanaerobaculaceae bacterium]HPS78722.1 hypothetical protein [Thermoanaerobaculaceae bacterium]